MKEYAEKHPGKFVYVRHKENLGGARQWPYLVENHSGSEYFMLLKSRLYLADGFVRAVIEALKAHPDYMGCYTTMYDMDYNAYRDFTYDFSSESAYGRVSAFTDVPFQEQNYHLYFGAALKPCLWKKIIGELNFRTTCKIGKEVC